MNNVVHNHILISGWRHRLWCYMELTTSVRTDTPYLTFSQNTFSQWKIEQWKSIVCFALLYWDNLSTHTNTHTNELYPGRCYASLRWRQKTSHLTPPQTASHTPLTQPLQESQIIITLPINLYFLVIKISIQTFSLLFVVKRVIPPDLKKMSRSTEKVAGPTNLFCSILDLR